MTTTTALVKRACTLLFALLLAAACAGGGGGGGEDEKSVAAGASCKPFGAQGATPARPPGPVTEWLADMRRCVREIPGKFALDANAAQRAVLDVYVNRQEYLEIYYGDMGRVSKGGPLGFAVMTAERMFHDLMVLTGSSPKPGNSKVQALVDSLDAKLAEVERIAIETKVPLTPPDTLDSASAAAKDTATRLAAMVSLAESARDLSSAGHRDSARRMIEQMYLEEFEPMEALLPRGKVSRIEELVHMRLRPRLAAGDAGNGADSLFALLLTELKSAGESMRGERTAWFGALSAFFIIVREGLEAVLLIAALVAYLSRSEDVRSHTKSVYRGAIVGIGVTVLTWIAARTDILRS